MKTVREVVFGPVGDDPVMFHRTCVMCGGETFITVDGEKYNDWTVHGVYVQLVWPDLSADDRELMISGTHSVCWDEMSGGDDE